ncbi:MAG: cell division topological specificity factor MinE [Aggregatilineales bacterium]
MTGFFDRMLGRGKEPTASKAKERLQFVLVHDRINLPPERLKEMKEEILAVISKYVAVASDEVDIALEQRDRNQNRLIAEIPFSKSIDKKDDTHPSRHTATSKLMLDENDDLLLDDDDDIMETRRNMAATDNAVDGDLGDFDDD